MTEALVENAYCSLDDVRARTLQRLRANDIPNQATVTEWIQTGAARIQSELWLYDLTMASTVGLQVLKALDLDYAAARVYGALQNESQANRLDERFEEVLEKVRNGTISLGIKRKARFRGGGCYYPPICPSSEDDDTTPVIPLSSDSYYLGWSDGKVLGWRDDKALGIAA